MIRLGGNRVFTYPYNGIRLEINGKLEFRGQCIFGNDTNISVGSKGYLIFGDQVMASAAVTVISHHKVSIGDDVLIGWETKIMDTDFHQLKSEYGKPQPKAFAPVVIGRGCWIATQCLIMQGTTIPANCVVGARSLTNHAYDIPEYTLLVGNPAKSVKHGVWHDFYDDDIVFLDE